jgi:hypothetical protein
MKLVLSFSAHVLTSTLQDEVSLGSPRDIIVLHIMAELPLRPYVSIKYFVDADTLLCVEPYDIVDGGILHRVHISVHTVTDSHSKAQ